MTKRYLTPKETIAVHTEMARRIEVISTDPPLCRWKDGETEASQVRLVAEASGVTDLTIAQLRRIRVDMFGAVAVKGLESSGMLEAKVDILRNDLRAFETRLDKLDELVDILLTTFDLKPKR